VCRSVLFAAAAAPVVFAQDTLNFASVGGRVTDPSGAVVAGAQVAARQTETNVTATAVTDGEGRFRYP
jgi:Carboxypeptidase regulatory-like domain